MKSSARCESRQCFASGDMRWIGVEKWNTRAESPDVAAMRARVEELEKRKTHTHEISACYYPFRNEIDLYWIELSTGNRAELTVKVSKKDGKAISDIVMPCVYQGAIIAPPK